MFVGKIVIINLPEDAFDLKLVIHRYVMMFPKRDISVVDWLSKDMLELALYGVV